MSQVELVIEETAEAPNTAEMSVSDARKLAEMYGKILQSAETGKFSDKNIEDAHMALSYCRGLILKNNLKTRKNDIN
jgi:hypothetical protein